MQPDLKPGDRLDLFGKPVEVVSAPQLVTSFSPKGKRDVSYTVMSVKDAGTLA